MLISRVQKSEHADFLSLVNAEIRPDRAKTNAWDDFPLILGAENRPFQLIARTDEGHLAGGIACLVRDFQTSCGIVAIAGIGSVVTHPDFRGKGLSTALQNEMLHLLRGKNVPLAVLWTDQPEIYSGRGFAAAGWEIHADLDELEFPVEAVAGYRVRPFVPEDWATVEALYLQHPLRTVRRPGDSRKLYTMPGTRGLVAVDESDQVQAALFCGKGADFPDYITEWEGPWDLVVHLIATARQEGLAHRVLIPAGQEGLVNLLVDHGASWFVMPSGCWKVLDGAALAQLAATAGETAPAELEDPQAWLGGIDDQGQPLVGPLSVAVWGFDSV